MLRCATEPVGWVDLFEQGEIKVAVRFAGEDFGLHSMAREKRAEGPPPRRLFSRKSFITSGWQAVKNLGALAKGALAVAQTAMEGANGEKWANYEGTEELAGVEFLNYNADGLDGARAPCEIDLAELFKKESDDVSFTGTCDNCYLYAGVTLNFGIKLKDWEVQELTTYVEGGIAANLAISSLNMKGAFAKSRKIATYISKEVSIPISGGPGNVFMKAEIPVTLALEGEMEGEMEVEGGAGGKLAMKSGVRFTPDGGGLKREMFQDFQTEARAQGFSPKKLSGEAALRLKLIPVINIQTQLGMKVKGIDRAVRLAKIGGPSVTLEFMAETLFSGNYDIDAGTGSAEMVPQIGVNGAIGSNMMFQLSLGSKTSDDLLGGKGKTDPVAIFSQKYPLAHFSLSAGGRRLSSHTAWKEVGTTWTGSLSTHPSKSSPCAGYPENLYLTWQLVEVDYGPPPPPGFVFPDWEFRSSWYFTFNVATSQGTASVDKQGEVFAEIKQEALQIGFRQQAEIQPCPAEISNPIIPAGHAAFIISKADAPEIAYEESTRGTSFDTMYVAFICREDNGLTRIIAEDSLRCAIIDMKQEVSSSRRLEDEPEEIQMECKDIENGGVIGFASKDDLERLGNKNGSVTSRMISTALLMALTFRKLF
jgi:hypothetical protein